jgi:phage-related protein
MESTVLIMIETIQRNWDRMRLRSGYAGLKDAYHLYSFYGLRDLKTEYKVALGIENDVKNRLKEFMRNHAQKSA